VLNAEYAKIWPNISVEKAPPLDAKEWEGKPDKFQYFLPNPGARPLNEVSSSKSVRLHAGAHFDHAACPYSVTQAGHAFGLCAMVAAEERAFLFEAVTDMNAAIVAGWSQRMGRLRKGWWDEAGRQWTWEVHVFYRVQCTSVHRPWSS